MLCYMQTSIYLSLYRSAYRSIFRFIFIYIFMKKMGYSTEIMEFKYKSRCEVASFTKRSSTKWSKHVASSLKYHYTCLVQWFTTTNAYLAWYSTTLPNALSIPNETEQRLPLHGACAAPNTSAGHWLCSILIIQQSCKIFCWGITCILIHFRLYL